MLPAPRGRSTHTEAGGMAGLNKKVIAYKAINNKLTFLAHTLFYF